MPVRNLFTLVLAALVAVATPASALTPEEWRSLLRHERYTLSNGLEVILREDHHVAAVHVSVWYHVGAFNDPPGRSGFAHLFEHLMNQGSEHVADYGLQLSRVGHFPTSWLAATSQEYTEYVATVPPQGLETVLWIESDRMGFFSPRLDERTLRRVRGNVVNERRLRSANVAYGPARLALWAALFPAPHPYHDSVIGSEEDLAAATIEEVRRFHRQWYVPSYATLAIVGDFRSVDARRLVERYFGSLPARPRPAPPHVEPARLDREVVVRSVEPIGGQPAVRVAWLSPAAFTAGDAAADLLAQVLAQRALSASQDSMSGQSIFLVQARASGEATLSQLVERIDAMLDRIRQDGPTEAEIRRAVASHETNLLTSLDGLRGFERTARTLERYNHYRGQANWLGEDVARFEAVTAEEIQRFAREILDPHRRVVVFSEPTGSARPAAGAQTPTSLDSPEGGGEP